MSVTYTQTEIDTLRAACASGVLTVSYSGPPARTVTYQSLAEMRKQLAAMEANLATTAGDRPRYRRAAIKGFNE